MSFRAVSSAILPAFGMLLVSGTSRADGLASSVAEALFEDGRRLMQEGNTVEGCSKLAESQRLEPATGTLLNLALCHERQGKLASAWLAYLDAIAMAAREKSSERERIGRERLEALEPRLSRVRFAVPEILPADFWIELDGVVVSQVGLGTGIPVDPGKHRVRFGANGRHIEQLLLVVNSAGTQTQSLWLPALLPERLPASQDNSERGWSLVSGVGLGMGAAGLASATYFGVRAASSWSERNRLCEGGCTQGAADAGDQAHGFAWAANVSAVVAALGVGTSVYALWLRPRSSGRQTLVSAHVGAGQASFMIRSDF